MSNYEYGSGYGCGDGYGYGCGDGDGSGYGCGDGYGYGYGCGDGYGYGQNEDDPQEFWAEETARYRKPMEDALAEILREGK